jgi:hypothetical protein
MKDLVWLTARERERRDQDIGIKDYSHRGDGSLADFVYQSVYILLRPDAEGLGL